MCQKRKLKYESQQEFVDLCSLLETRGILALKAAKERRLTKVSVYVRTYIRISVERANFFVTGYAVKF